MDSPCQCCISRQYQFVEKGLLNVYEVHTMVRLFRSMSLYTRIQYVSPSLILSAGPGEVPLTKTVDFEG